MAKKKEYKVKNTFRVDNASFNTVWATGVSEDDFVAHEKATGIPEEQLREYHKMMMTQANKSNGNDQKPVEQSKSVPAGKSSGK